MFATLIRSLLWSPAVATHVSQITCQDVNLEYKTYVWYCPIGTYLTGFYHSSKKSDGKTDCKSSDGDGACLSSVNKVRCCSMDPAVNVSARASVTAITTAWTSFNYENGCPDGYFVVGIDSKAQDDNKGWQKFQCYSPVGPAAASPNFYLSNPSRVYPSYAFRSSGNQWIECQTGRYVSGMFNLEWMWNWNEKLNDIFDIGLLCAVPMNADCGGAPSRANMSLTGDPSCTHQYCNLTQSCNLGYTPSTGTNGSQLICAANSTTFDWRGTQLKCVDVNECLRNCSTPLEKSDPIKYQCNNCHSQARCTNKLKELGGFDCTCQPGFTGNGTSCTDVLECTRPCNTLAGETPGNFPCHNCSANANCTELSPWFSCACNPGFGPLPACPNYNECAVNCSGAPTPTCNTCSPQASCTDTLGSYNCTCGPGWTGNGFNCTDLDECQLPACNGTNTPCYQCQRGAVCSNNLNGQFYSCPCDTGYTQQGSSCVNVNECLNATRCPNAACVDTDGSFICGPRFAFITISGTKLNASSAYKLLSSAQSPAEVVVFSFLNNTSPFTWTGLLFYGDSQNPTRYQATNCAPSGTNYTCNMAPGTGQNLVFYTQFNVSGQGQTSASFTDGGLFSYPCPQLTPSTLRVDQNGAGAASLEIPLIFGGTPIVWFNGTNLPPARVDLSVTYGPQNLPCVVKTSSPTMFSCALQSTQGLNMKFSLVAGHGTQACTVNSTDALNLTVAGPTILNISGCTQGAPNSVYDCPIAGTSLAVAIDLDIVSSVIMLIGGSSCLDPQVTSNRTFTCTLPSGSGTDLLVAVALLSGNTSVFSPAIPLLSYVKPTVVSISADGCSNLDARNVLCPTTSLNPPSFLTVTGSDFGPSSVVFIGSLQSTSVLKPCQLPTPGTYQCAVVPLPDYGSGFADHTASVSILQLDGEMNLEKASIRFAPLCAAGRYESGGVCVMCPNGTFSTAVGAMCNSTCTACPPGTYQGSAGSTTCSLCTPGFQQSSFGALACVQCAAGSFVDTFGAEVCFACEPGRYSNLPQQTTCLSCDAGKFQTQSNRTVCSSCPVGYYADVIGQVVCKACPPGYTNGVGGSVTCSPCLPGTFAKSAGSSVCQDCSAGSYSDTQAWSLDCQLCPPGTFLNTSQFNTVCLPCEPGKSQSVPGSANCTTCSPGRYAPSRASVCLDCSAGSFSAGGVGVCSLCLPGFYQSLPQSASCDGCPPGSWNRDPGSSSCVPCQIGTYSNISNATNCLSCPVGTYSNVESALVCMDCGVGHYQSSTGQSVCMECEPGRHGNNTAAADCEDCVAGTYTSLSASLECLNCEAGAYQSAEGQSACNLCDVGSYTDSEQQIACITCQAGTHSALEFGSTACLTCEYGKVSPASASACIDCVAGKFSNTTGQSTCTECSVGYFRAPGSLQTCLPCPIGSITPATASSSCTGCAPGKYSQGGGSQALQLACTDCAPGKYAPETGSTNCLNCSAGNYSVAFGTAQCRPCPADQVAPLDAATICTRCPPNSFPNAARVTCLCAIGYYGVADTQGTLQSCTRCTSEMLCTVAGLLDYEVPTAPGFWRPNKAFHYLRCPNQNFCLGGIGEANICIVNQHGPLCGLCDPGYKSAAGGPCAACASRESNLAQASLVLIVMIVLAIIGFYLILRVSNVQQKHIKIILEQNDKAVREDIQAQLDKYNTQDVGAQANDKLDEEEEDTFTPPNARVLRADERPSILDLSHEETTKSIKGRQTPNFVFKVKIMIGFFQIASILPNQGGIEWPKIFVNFITIFSFLNFDFMPWQSLGCVASIDYYDKVLIVGCTPLIVLALLLLFFYVPVLVKDESSLDTQIVKQQKHARTTRQLVKLLLFTIFLLYPFVSKTVVAMFNCVNINDEWYLLADLSLVCFSEQWTKYAYAAGFFILAYPLGTPLIYYALLRRHRNRLKDPATLFMLGFLYEAYTRQCFYWELLDMLHKLILTSIIIFLPNQYELVISMVVVILYLEMLLWLQPYIRKGDDRFHQLVQVELYLFCLMGFMLSPPNPIYLDAATDILVSIMLIILVAFLLSSFFIIAGRNVLKLIKRHKQQKKRDTIDANGNPAAGGDEDDSLRPTFPEDTVVAPPAQVEAARAQQQKQEQQQQQAHARTLRPHQAPPQQMQNPTPPPHSAPPGPPPLSSAPPPPPQGTPLPPPRH